MVSFFYCLTYQWRLNLSAGGNTMPDNHDIVILGSGSTAFAAALRPVGFVAKPNVEVDCKG